LTADDLQRIGAAQGWRERRIEVFAGTSVGTVLVKGQRAPRAPWRYRALNGIALVCGLPMLRAAPAPGGAAAQAVEVDRLRRLAAAGVDVPHVHHVDREFFVQSFVDGPLLSELLGRGGDAALRAWQRGLQALVDVHSRQQYLSQAFTRNMVADGDRLVMIDFEDDPLQAMPLVQAQARDWMAYLFTSVMSLPRADTMALSDSAHPMPTQLCAALAGEPPAVRRALHAAATRLSVLLRLRRRDTGWRRYLAHLQCTVTLLLAAQCAVRPQTHEPEARHARHH
jgi:hypothetical protein